MIAILDDSQFNIKKKFQPNPNSSNLTEATCCMFLEPTVFEYLQNIATSWKDVGEILMTYIDQVIPSPYGIPPFKMLSEAWAMADLMDDKISTFNESIDITGTRVEANYNVKRVLSFIRRLKNAVPYSLGKLFTYSAPQLHGLILKLNVCKKLKPNWKQTIPSKTTEVYCSWYHHILKSLYSCTKVWRGEPSPAKMLIPPVTPENEITNKGAANVVMLVLLYHNIVEPINNDGANSNVKGMKLADNYHEHYVMLAGDGLSQICVKTFENMIQ